MNKLLELIPALLLKTRQRKLDWESFGASSFIVQVGNSLIEVEQTSHSFDRSTVINVRDSSAQILETIRLPITSADGQVAAELFDLVRYQTLKIDETLDDISRSLDLL